MIDISIVSGTYNRLEYLKGMVASIRRSIGIGIPYEIVLVDGGSTDGTIDWCKSQKDIVLIEQGKLEGAVKAFNAGARAACGRYVVMANDDVEFVDESLIRALAFMDDNLDVGVGCFFQDRNKKPWHVERMPVIVDDKQSWHEYGQVCIVPRWLGDLVGWWGDLYHTYGGDNELSCNVLEKGYKVVPIRCACIHDRCASDDLRAINNAIYKDPREAAKHGQSHGDTIKWQKKWTNSKGLIGPHISTTPAVENPLTRSLRVLYVPIYESGHDVQKISKKGLRNALSRQSAVCEYDYVGVAREHGVQYCRDYTFDLAYALDPDVFLFQIQGVGEYNSDVIRGLKREHPDAIFVNWNGDYCASVLYNKHYIEMLQQFDITGIVTTVVKNVYDQNNINWFYWQIGYEESDAQPDDDTQRHDVVLMANGYSSARMKLVHSIKSIRDINFGLYGSWKGIPTNGYTLYDFDAGRKVYRASKMAIGDSQWPGATGFVSNRLFQAMAAGGTLLLQQYFDGMEELLGLKDGVHLSVWKDFDELKEKIDYWLNNEKERKKVAKTGTEYVLTQHAFDCRVNQLFDVIGV